jgi:hypothetical protein
LFPIFLNEFLKNFCRNQRHVSPLCYWGIDQKTLKQRGDTNDSMSWRNIYR